MSYDEEHNSALHFEGWEKHGAGPSASRQNLKEIKQVKETRRGPLSVTSLP